MRIRLRLLAFVLLLPFLGFVTVKTVSAICTVGWCVDRLDSASCSEAGLCSGSGTCVNGNCCRACPATPVPTAPPTGCWDCITNCCSTPTFYGGEGCMACPTRVPTNTPTPLVTPTPVCETDADGDNICQRGSSYCENDCYSAGNLANIYCYTNFACFDDGASWCSRMVGVEVGYDYCPGDTAPQPTSYCHPIQCQNVGQGGTCTIADPSFTINGCTSAARCDNCGGVDCSWCPGTVVASPVPTQTGCTESCISDPRYLTTCSNTTFSICSGTVNCFGAIGPNCGSECSNYSTSTTYTAPNSCGTCTGCNNLPAVTTGSLVIKNANGVVVPGEAGGTTTRNHICQTTFQDTTLPRRVRFEVTATDLDGGNTISSGTLTWRTRNYPLSVISVSGNTAVLAATVDFLSADNSSAVGDIYVTINDTVGGSTGQVNTQRDFRVWNCVVGVSGRIFDGSAAGTPSCTTNVGYSVPVDSGFNFRSLRFNRIDNSSKVNTTVTLPADYTTSPLSLTWGRSYNNLTTDWNYNSGDGALAGTTPLMRVYGGSIVGFSCGPINLSNSSMIDPYSSANSLTVDYSSVLNQEAWWQVDGSGVRTNSTLTDSVPVTCAVSGTCTAAVSKDDATLGNDNGLVSATSIDNNSGCGSSCAVGDPDDRYYEGGILNESFTYDKLKSDYYDTYSEGRILSDGGDYWATIKADVTNKVIFVNGNLNINSNRTLAANSFSMVVVSGTITIDPSVTRVDGIYMADNGISIAGDNATQLVIQGMLHSSSGNISITRSYTSGAANNTSPAVLIKYRPDMIFNMPANLSRALSNWRGGI